MGSSKTPECIFCVVDPRNAFPCESRVASLPRYPQNRMIWGRVTYRAARLKVNSFLLPST